MYWVNLKDWYIAVKNFCHNVWRYRKWLTENYEWDFYFLDDIIKCKLEEMSKYFATAQITEGEEHYAWQCTVAKKLLEAYENDDYIICGEEDENGMTTFHFNRYVNMKNIRRFMSEDAISAFDKTTVNGKELLKDEYYRVKARKIFFEWMGHYSAQWWD